MTMTTLEKISLVALALVAYEANADFDNFQWFAYDLLGDQLDGNFTHRDRFFCWLYVKAKGSVWQTTIAQIAERYGASTYYAGLQTLPMSGPMIFPAGILGADSLEDYDSSIDWKAIVGSKTENVSLSKAW